MKWNEYTIKTVTEAEDLVSELLMELGIEGVEILDNVPLSKEDKEAMYIDILPELPKDDGVAYVRFYLEEGNPEQDLYILEQVHLGLEERSQYAALGECTIKKGQTEDTDWENNWKEFFKPFYLDDILIKPTWEPIPKEAQGKTVIEIDPGTSFGTGQHETTQLCIRQLRQHMNKGDKVLDLGCGSGILSAICLKLGAAHVTGTDIDPICMKASRENMVANQIKENRYHFLSGNLITEPKLQAELMNTNYDCIVANILADVIIPMAPAAYPLLKKNGYFITSGIIDFKEEQVKQAISKAGYTIMEITHQGEWVSITARK
ncbi:MAG: 50S ribosomal protein L11 methyltransferase [Lachnospiraceae bacterium]